MSLVDCRSTTARWQAARCRLSSTSWGLLQLFVVRGSGSERGSTPLFRPPSGNSALLLCWFGKFSAAYFCLAAKTPTPIAQKRLCQKPPKNIAGIFAFGVVDKSQPKVQGPRMFFFCPTCKIWHVVVLDAEPHNQCDLCKADLLTEGQRRSK